jgi:N-acetylmuramoyl-L-alanine amidase
MPTNGISGTNNNKNSKPRSKPANLAVLTYSVSPDLEKTLITLNNRGASVHYIIEENGNQIQFTNDATDETFCCGKSEFRGQTSLNQVSINMMLINDAKNDFKKVQIDKLIVFFQDLAQRYPHLDLKIDVAGLGEAAIVRKEDVPAGEGKIFPRHKAPGREFPWEECAQHGIGLFLSTTPEQKAETCISPESSKEEILSLQNSLKAYGYAIEASGIYDAATKEWVNRFNKRYVPDVTEQLDPTLWSKASQLSLEHVLAYINTKTNIVTQLPSSQNSFFNPPSAPAANTIDESVQQTSTLNIK